MEDITFAQAIAADLPAVRALLERCQLPTADLSPAHLERFTVCRRNDELVATVGIEALGDTALLRSLAVIPELRGRRLAHALWQRARDEAVRCGIGRLYLLTNTAAGLFSSWGFRAISRDAVPEAVRATAEYSSLCGSSATVMTIELAPDPDQRLL
jgi:amino-acid N-acetyltransferase